MRGGCGRRTFVVCSLVVSGLPFWPSSGSGGLLLLDMVVSPNGRVRVAWVTSGWGFGGVFELSWGGCEGQAPRCNLLGVLGSCRLPRVFVYGFGAYYKVQLLRCPSWFFGLSKDFHKVLILFGCHFIFSF
jgi:hypothetical protein